MNSTLPEQPLLEISGLSKSFGRTQALRDVSLSVEPGQVHALLGENGAGKSTLIKILAGVYRADAGEIRIEGEPVDPGSEQLPISFIHQDLALVEQISVAENVALGAGYPRRFGLIDWRALRRRSRQVLDRMGSGVPAERELVRLDAADRSMVAIGRAMAVEAKVLVLDEPSAALPGSDVERLFGFIDALRADRVGIIYVTHRLDEVFRIADQVTVLRDGRRQSSKPVGACTQASLVEDIVGRPMVDVFPRAPEPGTEEVLAVHELLGEGVGPISFTLRAGELLGLVGLRGAGHELISRMIAGAERPAAGSVEVRGEPVRPGQVSAAVAAGIGFVSGKRVDESLAPEMSVRENLFPNLRIWGQGSTTPIGLRRERQQARAAIDDFGVRPPTVDGPIMTLSGGNQQKVVLARWISAEPDVLVLEEPTAGVDVGAKAEIYRLLLEALARGAAILMVSSDFEEVSQVCHGALVMNRGRIVAELGGEELTIERITALAAGETEEVAANVHA